MSDYDWTRCPALDLWVIKIKLEALCRVHERKQGWVPCRVIRRVAGVPK